MPSHACQICGTVREFEVQEETQELPCEKCSLRLVVAGRRPCREAGERMRLETFRRLGITPPAPLGGGRGRYVGETADAQRRRVAISRGEDPDA